MSSTPLETIPRRVKVYTLAEERWEDRGTGFCRGVLAPTGPKFLVLSEGDPNDVLLDEPIEGTTQYQRQQDTLIVWTSVQDVDYALSFQEPQGCQDLCDFLINVQRTAEHGISLVAVHQGENGEQSEIIAGPQFELEQPSLDNLLAICDSLTLTQYKSTIMFKVLHNQFQWLKELIFLFHMCEERHLLDHLHRLSDIVKTLVYYNEMDLFEAIIEKDIVDGVVGILEYDHDYPQSKMNLRHILGQEVKIHNVMEIHSEHIREEVRRCCVLQFLRDVALARFLDDAGINCISTMIQIKESHVIDFIKDDPHFLPDLFSLYAGPDENVQKLRDGICMLHQFVKIVKNGQIYQRIDFYKAAIDQGLLKMIEFSASNDMDHIENRVLTSEIIMTIVEQDVSLFKTADDKFKFDSILLNMLIDVLVNDPNIGLKTQAFEALKIIINPSNLVEESDSPQLQPEDMKLDQEFYQGFYDTIALRLFAPLQSIDKIESFTQDQVICYSNLCELLAFIASFHDRHFSRSFIMENHLLDGVAKLIHPRIGYLRLRLNAFRSLKLILFLNDEFYTRYIIANNLLANFVTLLKECNDQNNLVNSSCLSLLYDLLDNEDFTNYKLLQTHLVTQYRDQLMKNYIGEKLVQLEDNKQALQTTTDADNADADDIDNDETDDIKTDFDLDPEVNS